MKQTRIFLAFAFTALLVACSDDSGIVDQPFPENPPSLTGLELSGYIFDTDTMNVPPVGIKNPDDPVTIPIGFSVHAAPGTGATVEDIRVTITPQGRTTPVFDETFQKTSGDVFSGTLNMNIVRNNADDYNVRVEAVDSRGVAASPAISKIVVLNGKYPPVMSDFVGPDSLQRPATGKTQFLFTVRVTDPSGPNDIWRVYYRVYRPDGTTNGTSFILNDDGRDGDAVAGDSIYSAGAEILPENALGTYTFQFYADDRSELAATPIIHKIVVY